MSATRVRAVWLAAESTYGSDPDSDGSDYLPIRFDGNPEPVHTAEVEDVGNASGRNAPPELVYTRSGAKIDLAIPLPGFATGSGDGAAAPTADVIDLVLANACGAAIQATGGEGVAASSLTTNIILDAAITGLTAGSLLPVYFGDDILPNNTQWRRVGTVATATYPVVPDWPSAPTTTAVAYGVRGYGQANNLSTPTTGLAAVVNVAGTLHRLLGGRVSALSFDWTTGKKAMANVSLMFDSWESGVSMASLPVVTSFPAPAMHVLSPFWFNSTAYATKSVKVDMGITAVEVGATAGANGRGGIEVVSIDPVVTIEPAWAPSVWNTAFTAGTVGELLTWTGGAFRAAGRPNSIAFHALRAQVQAAPPNADDGGYLRQTVAFRVLDSGADAARRWQVARC